MKSLIPTILTLLFFSPISVFAEEIKDVGLICKKNESNNPLFRGVWFEGNQKTEWYVGDGWDMDKDGDTFEIVYDEEFSESWKYTFDRNKISFQFYLFGEFEPNRSVRLDRFTLEMKEMFYGVELTHQCESYKPKELFLKEVKKREQIVRDFFDKRKI